MSGALYVYLQQGHFRQSQFEFAIAVANLTSRALARAREDDRRECDVADAAAELGIGQELIGASRGDRELREQSDAVAAAGRHILLRGERGIGKKLAARWLHETSARLAGQTAGPFVVYPCGQASSIEEAGHDEEAAADDWLRAEGGTLYLDEIGRLPLAAQPEAASAARTRGA